MCYVTSHRYGVLLALGFSTKENAAETVIMQTEHKEHVLEKVEVYKRFQRLKKGDIAIEVQS